MKYIIGTLIIFILTGCNTLTPPLPALEKLSNDELCQLLGDYNHDGKIVLKIYREIDRRRTVNTERCLALEIKAKDGNDFNYYKNNTKTNKDYYFFKNPPFTRSMLTDFNPSSDIYSLLNQD